LGPVRSTLRSPRLRRIIAAYAINRLGTWFGVVALSLAVFDHTHSAIAVAGLLIAAQVLPALVVPAVVARVEASKRRGELSNLYFFEFAATIALAILLWSFWLPAILLLVALDGVAALAASALLRTEAARAARESGASSDPQEDEKHANAAINLAFSITFVSGPALAGVMVAGAGASSALFLDAATFLAAGMLLLDLHPHVEEAASETVAARVRAAWRYVNSAPALRRLLLVQALALVFFESAAPIEVTYAKVTLHAGDRGYGVLMGVWGAGVVLGGLLFARLPARLLGWILLAGTAAVGLAYIGFAAAPTLALACVAAALGGVGNGMQWAPLVSAVQNLTPPALLGRVMGALEGVGAIAPAIGLTLGGVLVGVSDPRVAFLAVGAGAVLATAGFVGIPLAAARAPAVSPGASEQPGRPGSRPARAVGQDPVEHATPR
jgi:MFS family permease